MLSKSCYEAFYLFKILAENKLPKIFSISKSNELVFYCRKQIEEKEDEEKMNANIEQQNIKRVSVSFFL